MTIQDILYLAVDELGLRNQITPMAGLRYLNQVQMDAWSSDISAFVREDIKVDKTQYDSVNRRIAVPANCRKFVGITSASTASVLGYDKSMDVDGYRSMSLPGPLYMQGLRCDGRYVYFPEGFDSSVLDNYRWVFYALPPTIANFNDENALVIPPQYHMSLGVLGVIYHADRAVNGLSNESRARQGEYENKLREYWDSLFFARDPDRISTYSEGMP